jgi:hypothetical protein
MSPAATSAQKPQRGEGADLLREVEAYLRAVDAFRREGCAPRWRPEAPA